MAIFAAAALNISCCPALVLSAVFFSFVFCSNKNYNALQPVAKDMIELIVTMQTKRKTLIFFACS